MAGRAAKRPKRGPRPSELPFVPVPGAVCEVIRKAFHNYRNPQAELGEQLVNEPLSDNIETLAFNVVSHLLAVLGTKRGIGGTHHISTETFHALGARKGSKTQVDVLALSVAKIITKTSLADRGAHRAAEYALSSDIKAALLDASDLRLFASWSRYPRAPLKPSPSSKLDNSFGRRLPERTDLGQAVVQLQHVGIGFDKHACLSYLATNPNALSERQLEHLSAFIGSLHHGLNFPRYRLAESGRVQTFGQASLQNVPRVIRRFFYAPKGYCFLDFDYRSQEPHILAHLSGDERLMADLSEDLYKAIAREFNFAERDMVKTIVNGLINGGGAYQLAKEAFEVEWGTPSKPLQDLIKNVADYLQAIYPAAMGWLDAEAERIALAGRAESEDGFLRVLTSKAGRGAVDLGTARKTGISHRLQGTGADIMRCILATLPARLGGLGKVALPMHDGLLVIARESDLAEVSRIVRMSMAASLDAILPGVKIPVKEIRGWRREADSEHTSNVHP